ncbi:MAG TPA: hypothetical protein VJP80_03895 [Candidatus Saccharimonadales bacterium]|nr:hypothetical protein [Candidatus Saccharimonadales bacterium]
MTAEDTIKQKFAEWKECLEGKEPPKIDPNSVSGVLYSLFWEMGAYESYVAICRNNPKSPLATLLFGNLTAYNYIQVQAIRIRRLCEPPTAAKEEKDTSIYSLRRIVDGLKEQRKAGLLTRENLCAVYGIPPSKQEVARQFDEATSGVSGSFSTDSIIAGNTHAMLDDICDKNGLKKSLLDKLDKRLLVDKNAQLSEIIYFVDKHIVHSASDDSRKQVGELALRVADMKKVIQDITEVFFCCNMLIAQADTEIMTVGWQNQLTNLSTDEMTVTHTVFDGIEKESKTWKQTGYGLLGL